MTQVYSLKEAKWTTLNLPQNDGVGGALGCWDIQLFVVLEDGELSVSVWDLVDKSKQASTEAICLHPGRDVYILGWWLLQRSRSLQAFAVDKCSCTRCSVEAMTERA